MASNLKKPTLVPTDVEAFAKRTTNTPSKTTKGSQVPDGDVRLTVNIRSDLHKRLKIAAINKEMTVGELIENFAKTL